MISAWCSMWTIRSPQTRVLSPADSARLENGPPGGSALPDLGPRCVELFHSGQNSDIFDAALRDCGTGSRARTDFCDGARFVQNPFATGIEIGPQCGTGRRPDLAPNWPIAVVTDGPPISQSRKCESLGLVRLADPIVLTGAFWSSFPQTPARRL